MQQDQENYFDESIRRKLQDEEYSPPAFNLSMQESAGPGYKWLRGFLFGDLLLLLVTLVFSINGRDIATASETRIAGAEQQATQQQNGIQEAVSEKSESRVSTQSSGKSNDEVVNTKQSDEVVKRMQSDEVDISGNPGATSASIDKGSIYPSASTSRNASIHKTSDGIDTEIVQSKKKTKSSRSNSPVIAASASVPLASAGTKENANDEIAYTSSQLSVIVSSEQEGEESAADLGYMQPLPFTPDAAEGATVRTRDFSHTPRKYRKPFSLEPIVITEISTGYNHEFSELGELNLDMTPRNNAYGAGILFNYRIHKFIGVKTGVETVIRKYNLNYSFTQMVMVLQPDSITYMEEKQVLTNSRIVSEAEIRIPMMVSYEFSPGKWLLEPELGVTIKFKNLEVTSSGSDQIPATVLSTIEVSNEHLVTAGWMVGFQAAYPLSENTLVSLTPYYQAESFGSNSRQYYTGRVVSGYGVKAGLRFFFNQ